jgi:hypothetical protein
MVSLLLFTNCKHVGEQSSSQFFCQTLSFDPLSNISGSLSFINLPLSFSLTNSFLSESDSLGLNEEHRTLPHLFFTIEAILPDLSLNLSLSGVHCYHHHHHCYLSNPHIRSNSYNNSAKNMLAHCISYLFL